MRIEEEVFARHKLIPGRLIDYGFKTENDRLAYTRELPDDGIKIIVEYDGDYETDAAAYAASNDVQLKKAVEVISVRAASAGEGERQ